MPAAEQHCDEHQRHRHRQRHRERAERGRAALQRLRRHLDRLAHDAQHVVREGQVLARELGEADHLSTRARRRAGGRSPRASRRIRSARSRPSTSNSCPRNWYVAAVADQLEQVERLLGDPLRQRGVGGLHLGLDRVLHEPPSWPGPRRCRRPRRCPARARLDLRRRGPSGYDQRAQHVAVAHLLDRLRAAVHAHRVDRVEQRARLRQVDLARRPARSAGRRATGRCRRPPRACPGPRESAKPISTAITIG